MEEHKKERLWNERVHILDTRLQVLWEVRRSLSQEVQGDIFPRRRDFALIPEIRKIVDAPNDITVDASCFDVFRSSISDIVKTWLSERKAIFEGLIKAWSPTLCEGSLRFDFVMTSGLGFQCDRCYRTFSFPGVLFHWCSERPREPLDACDPYECALSQRGNAPWKPFDYDHISVAPTSLKPILDALKIDETATTLAEMDALETRLCCTNCNSKDGCIGIMSWRDAVCSYY